MMRKQALTTIMVAGYRNDNAGAIRAYIENRVSYAAYQKAWQAGQRKREEERSGATRDQSD